MCVFGFFFFFDTGMKVNMVVFDPPLGSEGGSGGRVSGTIPPDSLSVHPRP